MNAGIKAVGYYLPEKLLDNDMIVDMIHTWSSEKIYNKTGIRCRHVAADDETSLDMGYKAAVRLIEDEKISVEDIDLLIFVTQLPDHLLPANACILHGMLGMGPDTAAFDISLGCSGFVYALSVAKSMIESETAHNALLITADTLCRYVNDKDRSLKTLIGDGASATLVSRTETGGIGSFVLGTEGAGKNSLIIPAGGEKMQRSQQTSAETADENGNVRSQNDLYMNGSEVFDFSLRVVPATVAELLERSAIKLDDIDLFVFHQANMFMLSTLKTVLGISDDRFYVNIENVGNTASSSIPIALSMAMAEGKLRKGMRVMIVGFGVGLSWGGTIIDF
ncbi:3-oxoacyl-ACP synthase III family protein [uncultured Ruminococcus sp.]|uniref:3-oxoacyl-ACP synthase III family protein n=1 Tax=uncultured Ruminococcus sp. TaxID=165186 RepID=UPI00260EA18B|nr:ketoacyl-ACP synthase III [uncultured Ruminococcus sp.]